MSEATMETAKTQTEAATSQATTETAATSLLSEAASTTEQATSEQTQATETTTEAAKTETKDETKTEAKSLKALPRSTSSRTLTSSTPRFSVRSQKRPRQPIYRRMPRRKYWKQVLPFSLNGERHRKQ
jgi:hypothetical protein